MTKHPFSAPLLAAATLSAALLVGCTGAEAPAGLAGSAWQAVRLSDGTVPEDPSRLTVAFGANGRAAVRADCNRGSGTWQSPAGQRLTFGPIATTKMACPPGSPGDQFLADLARAGAYALSSGQLEIATGNGMEPLLLEPAAR